MADFKVRVKATGEVYEVERMICGNQIAIIKKDGKEWGLIKSQVDLIYEDVPSEGENYKAGYEAGKK